MYDQLLFLFGQLQTACGQWWPAEHFHPWAAIWLADYLRSIIDAEQFVRLMALVNSDYLPLAECIVENTSPAR